MADGHPHPPAAPPAGGHGRVHRLLTLPAIATAQPCAPRRSAWAVRPPAGSRGGPLDLPDEALEAGDFLLEGPIAGGREIDPGPGAFAFVPLLEVHQPGLFQDGQVLPEVAGGQV